MTADVIKFVYVVDVAGPEADVLHAYGSAAKSCRLGSFKEEVLDLASVFDVLHYDSSVGYIRGVHPNMRCPRELVISTSLILYM